MQTNINAPKNIKVVEHIAPILPSAMPSAMPPIFKPGDIPMIPLCDIKAKTPNTAQKTGCRCSSSKAVLTITKDNKYYCK